MILLGKYRENYRDPALPSIRQALGAGPHPEKALVLLYLKSFEPQAVAPGAFDDCISGKKGVIPAAGYGDGVYCWRSDLIYYVEHYDLVLPEEFVAHALREGKRKHWRRTRLSQD